MSSKVTTCFFYVAAGSKPFHCVANSFQGFSARQIGKFDHWKGKNSARRRKASKREAENIKNGSKEQLIKSHHL
jgi:hypothetical protein